MWTAGRPASVTAVDPMVGTRQAWTAPVLVGAVCGLAWAASLRVVMAEFAGPESTFDWFGTFEGVLLPGAVVGALLGWAAHLRGRAPRWLVAAPLVFVLFTPSALVSVFVDGLGGGAIAVPLLGMAGGYALAGRGPRWTRWAAGAVALLAVPGWLVLASFAGGTLAPDTPRGAWVAVLFLSLLAVLSFGAALPHRAPGELRTSRRLVLVGVVCGLAWGAGMRGFMAAAAATDEPSQVSWLGTFAIILPISAVVGGLLGWAEHLRRTGDPRRLRRTRFAPLLFTVDPASLLVTLPALAGGYALSGRGSARKRWILGGCALLPVPTFFAAVAIADGNLQAFGTPRTVWITVLLFSLLAVLTAACVIPQRLPAPIPATATAHQE
jgi:hypothetical protein